MVHLAVLNFIYSLSFFSYHHLGWEYCQGLANIMGLVSLSEYSWSGGAAGSTSGTTHLPSLSAGSFQGNSLPDTAITSKPLHMLCSPRSPFISVWPWACLFAMCRLNQKAMYPTPLGCRPREHPRIRISPQTVHGSCPPRGSARLSSWFVKAFRHASPCFWKIIFHLCAVCYYSAGRHHWYCAAQK